jgi:hypothetical protein
LEASGFGKLAFKGIFSNGPSKEFPNPEDGSYAISPTGENSEPVRALISKYRVVGNDFFRVRRFVDADVAYTEAIRLADLEASIGILGTEAEQSAR